MEPSEIVAAVQEYGSISEAARALGVPRKTLADRYNRLKKDPLVKAKADRREQQGFTFWRNRARELDRALSDAEYIAEQLAGIRQGPIEIPRWLTPPPIMPGRSVVGVHLTDVHCGEVIEPGEINGLNAYNVSICRERIRHFMEEACRVGLHWGHDTRIEGAYLALGGDLISGDIHEELRITNELTSLEQVRVMVGEVVASILMLAKTFGQVHVASVPGNHGRTTIKSTAKLYSRLSYDTMIADMAREALKGDHRITWQISSGTDVLTPILGRTVLLTHGDKVGTGGGMGFIGPAAPIVRGAKKVSAQTSFYANRPDLIIMGHFHSSQNPAGVLAGGSVAGYSEYANGIRASVEPAQQWLFLMTDTEGLRDRKEVKLSTFGNDSRVYIPSNMAA